MSKKQYHMLRVLTIVIIAGLSGTAGAQGGWYLGLLLVAAIIALLSSRYLSPKMIKEVTIDERTQLILEKASAMAIQIFIVAAVITGAILIVISYKADSGFDFRQIGLTLAYSAVAIGLLHLVLRFYYGRKF
jgi:uncharacterized membrane protein